jgi:hypothetical protein
MCSWKAAHTISHQLPASSCCRPPVQGPHAPPTQHEAAQGRMELQPDFQMNSGILAVMATPKYCLQPHTPLNCVQRGLYHTNRAPEGVGTTQTLRGVCTAQTVQQQLHNRPTFLPPACMGGSSLSGGTPRQLDRRRQAQHTTRADLGV